MKRKNEFSTFEVDGQIIKELVKNVKVVERKSHDNIVISVTDKKGKETEFECFICDEGD